MASQDTNVKEHADLLQTFKAKVEDALSLLPLIPNELRTETWTYWTVVSAAVKTALGGRGPVVPGSYRRYGVPRGRPKIRSPVQKTYRNLDKLDELCAGVNNDNKNLSGQYENPRVEDSFSNSEISSISSDLIPHVASQETVESVTEINRIDKDFVDLQTAVQMSSAFIVDNSVAALSDNQFVPHQIIVKVSEGGTGNGVSCHVPQNVNIVSLPSPPTALKTSYEVPAGSENCILVPPVGMNVCLPASEPVKRKRGRPPKHCLLARRKVSLECQASLATVSENAVETAVTLLQRNVHEKQSDITETGQNANIVSDQQVSGSVGSPFKKELTKELSFIITALEQEIAKDTVQPFLETLKSKSDNQPSGKVRRSERRTAPNRDSLYCYFDQIKPEEEEEEEGEAYEGDTNESSEDKTLSVSQVPRGPRAKTEEEKIKERTCPICKTLLGCSSSMAAHMRIHTGERPFSCHICKKQFTTKANCERHEATHLGIKAFVCSQCNKNFTEKKSLKIHMRSHTGERPYACNICGMRFFQTGTLKTHMDRHTGHKGHLCDLCGKAFRQRCQLAVHVRRHKKDMSFSCQHCNMLFYTKSDLERHLPKHTGERRFTCTICPRTFTRLQYLREHVNVHLGHRPYECSSCGMSFHDLASCHRHVQKHKQVLELQTSQQQLDQGQDKSEQQLGSKVQVIIDKQSFGLDAADLQTLIVASEPNNFQQYLQQDLTTTAIAPSTCPAATIASPNSQSVAQAIFNNICLDGMDTAEIYHVTLVDPAASSVQVSNDSTVEPTEQNGTGVDFSAINLLASATTQLS